MKNAILIDDQKKEYVEKAYGKCPWCNSIDIEGGPIEIDSNEALQEVGCLECGKGWIDVYRLYDVYEMEG